MHAVSSAKGQCGVDIPCWWNIMLPLYSIVEEDDDTALIVESQPDPNWVNKTGLADPVHLIYQ